ncbi:gamma-glutamyl-gamma-aminobutyrate hydrolase family protein [Halioglobus maricola]|uniref:Gamma-glutamyl-gamma-aminobutyrate hydrolase family protein n=2 Tax=Halioglobus maricola TaxID=2601894 RepID=A0A5P9NPW9_9GAMM|nr:gamma-glutamyl-gamma-aminobutyrate hydrolase family protein [Halioglobus maricola]
MTALAVLRAGGTPRRIRPGYSYQESALDGLIIGGGTDVDPLHYGEEPPAKSQMAFSWKDWLVSLALFPLRILFARHSAGDYDPDRDALEKQLISHALYAGKPLLGICRGAQLLNVTLGGSLHQSIEHFYSEGTGNPRSVLPAKTVMLAENSTLATVLSTRRCRVNALHEQSIKELGGDVIVSAREASGVIQAIELSYANFVIGVQWHPEYMPQSIRQQGLFRHLVYTARAGQSS